MCDEQNLECVLRDLVTENADLQSRNQTKDRKLVEAQQQLREIVNFNNLFKHCNSTVFSDLQEEQMANDAETHSRLLREKVSVEFISLTLYTFLTAGGTAAIQ